MIESKMFTLLNHISWEQVAICSLIVCKFAKIKGDMVVFENISRKKNKKYFEELEKILNEYQR